LPIVRAGQPIAVEWGAVVGVVDDKHVREVLAAIPPERREAIVWRELLSRGDDDADGVKKVVPLLEMAPSRHVAKALVRRLKHPGVREYLQSFRRFGRKSGLGAPRERRYTGATGIKAVVRNGKLVIDEPVSLPEGMVLDLVIDDEGDNLDAEERALLYQEIEKSCEEYERGEGIPAEEVLKELRAKRS
jgi:hypothetical protein